MCSSVHAVCVRCSNMARGGRRSWTRKPAGCFKTSPAISAQAVYYSTQRTNKSPRFLLLQQPIPFGQFAVFIFCFVLVRARLYSFRKEAVLKPNKLRWTIADRSVRLFTDPVGLSVSLLQSPETRLVKTGSELWKTYLSHMLNEKVDGIDCTDSRKSHFILAADWVNVCDRWIAARAHLTHLEVAPQIRNRLKGLWDVKRLWMWVRAGSLWRPRASGCPSGLRFPLQAQFIRAPLIGSVEGRKADEHKRAETSNFSGSGEQHRYFIPIRFQ